MLRCARNDGGYNCVRRWLYAPEGDRAGKRSGSRADCAAIVAAVNDPLAVGCLSRDDADMMRPDHHHADSRTAGIRAFVRPAPRERKAAIGFAEIFAEVTAAPGTVTVMMSVLRSRFCLNGRKDDHERRRDKERL